MICGQLISVIRSAALVGERDRGLLAAATELEHPLALDVVEQAVGPLVRDVGPVAHDVVRQGRLGGERGGEGAGSGAAGEGSRCIRGSQMAGTVVLSGGAPERRPTAWVRLGQRAKRIAPVYITGRTRRPARALPRRGTGWAGSS